MRKFLISFFLIIISFLLQTTAMPAIAIADISPNLILIIVAFCGYINGRTAGLYAGFFAGLLIDFQYNTIIGLYALIYMLVAYLCGFCHKIYFRDDTTMPIAIIFISDFIYGILEYIFNFAFRNKLEFTFYIKRIIMPELLYTIILAIVLYRPILFMYKHNFKKKIHLKKETDTIV